MRRGWGGWLFKIHIMYCWIKLNEKKLCLGQRTKDKLQIFHSNSDVECCCLLLSCDRMNNWSFQRTINQADSHLASSFWLFLPLGGLFSPLPNDNDHQATDPQEIAFRYAVDKINADNKILPRSKLHAEIERIMPQDSFHASKRVCHLMKTGVAAIFGPQSSHTASHVQSICDTMEVSWDLIHLKYSPRRALKTWWGEV